MSESGIERSLRSYQKCTFLLVVCYRKFSSMSAKAGQIHRFDDNRSKVDKFLDQRGLTRVILANQARGLLELFLAGES